MNHAKSIIVGSLLAVTFVGLAWLGNETGKRAARAGWLQGSITSINANEDHFLVPPRPRVTTGGKAELSMTEVADELEELLGGSGGYGPDWDRRMRAQAILEGLEPAELKDLFRELKVRIAEPWDPLLNLVLLEWVRRDPAAAFAATSDVPGRAASVFAEWAMEEPTRALEWLDSENCPLEMENSRDQMRARALRAILERDFDLATSELLKLPSDDHRGGEAWLRTRQSVLTNWAYSALMDPGLRERLVEFVKTTGAPEDHATLNNEMLRHWSQDDAMGMLTYLYELKDYLESANFPAEKRAALEAKAVGAAIYREYDGPALEWWMGRHADSHEVPSALRHAMSSWHQKYPDTARGWFEGEAPSPQRDAMLAGLLPSIATRDPSEAEQMLGMIGDADLRERAAERLDYMKSESPGP